MPNSNGMSAQKNFHDNQNHQRTATFDSKNVKEVENNCLDACTQNFTYEKEVNAVIKV